ncbi:MAG: DUF664 domain-containing protein [Gemmatimonadales bacterium]|nr:DUF664 domain-containing protein [Gemmatimonadales bacterium]NIN09827.1 DUF664 domain-containing protein [Gemmatimonadales bacterium]NIN48530.1 DUF664 domain-containing protein [Gemmatimonadales bacterium]NIP05994.1 DUF664 domain-containing protein [Gemmatimonadales bacterium]NIR01144.1 DUF664 domain-containing protein [Gemmatimonadales bacterium]
MHESFLAETLAAWRDARSGIVDEVQNIPANRFDFRPTPEVRSVREMVQHILEVSMMMTGELTRSNTNFRRAPWPKLLAMYAKPAYEATTKRELVSLLRSTMKDAERRFRECGELEMWQFITNFDGSQGTKMQWLHHGIAQEMYHRGQLATYARLLGLKPALTKRIEGEA